MSDKPCLVLYASNHGHTRKIALRIAQRLRDEQLAAVEVGIDDARTIDLADYGTIVIGGSLHAGRHQRPLVRWMRERAATLNAHPTAVFSVSLSQGDKSAKGQDAARECLDALLADTGVKPARSVCFAGALQFPAYNLATRWLMRRIARKQGLATDLSKTVDLTDWDDVDRFSHEIGALAGVLDKVA